jgi:hypothetical protein
MITNAEPLIWRTPKQGELLLCSVNLLQFFDNELCSPIVKTLCRGDVAPT